jgi:CheY-like chemotaxis protein
MAAILIIDDDKNFRALMREFFKGRYEVATAGSGAEAMTLCAGTRFDLAISDVSLPDMKGPDVLVEIRKLLPAIKAALITSYNIDDFIGMAKRYGISEIIPKTVPFNFTELETMVARLVSGDIFGLRKYLLSGATMFGPHKISSSTQGRRVRERLVKTFTLMFGSPGDMKLMLDEILTNAIYHAPHNPDGTEKYPELTDIQLQPDEYVQVEWGYDLEKYGVSVIDKQGKLTKETILSKIERQIAGTGLLDDSGRGLHISRMLSDRLIINLQKNVRTEVILMNYISKKYQGYKPLYINEI